MNTLKKTMVCLTAACILLSACKATRTQKGAVIGTAGGAAVGAVIGKASGNAALGAIIGATVGGATGAVIGRQMDKQAEEIKRKVPDAKVERVGEGIVVEFSDQILFGFDRSDLSSGSRQSLDKLVTVLQSYPETNIEIQGHTDDKGTESYNEKLSKRRAKAVSSYLNSRNISSSRLSTRGYGESAPKYGNESTSGQAQNRRVEFLITANADMKEAAKKEAGGK